MKSNGLVLFHSFSQPSSISNRSATNSMYWHIKSEFIPINRTGNASVTNSFSIATASMIIKRTISFGSWLFTCLVYKWQAKSQCNPSSLEINSFEKVSPGINPLFLSQKMEQNDPEKKIPSTAAKAINRSWKEPLSIHLKAQSAFFFTQSMCSMALSRRSRSTLSLM